MILFFLRISILLVVFHLMLWILLTYQVWGGVGIIPILRTYAIRTLDYVLHTLILLSTHFFLLLSSLDIVTAIDQSRSIVVYGI